ncbi:MAG: ferric uptake regulator, Fur family [Deltaproteobacteria bacterium]|nr:ferric uptake regulator, Fur family [Deltaproteobacteria bacterium]
MAKNLDELRDAVRACGLRATPSRIAVLELVRTSGSPISHADAADRLALQVWDRATIYRNLTDLAEAGLLRRTDVGDHVWRFEALAPGDDPKASHAHFVCTECGTIECLPELEISTRRAKVPRAVKQRQVEVHVRGLCDGCS